MLGPFKRTKKTLIAIIISGFLFSGFYFYSVSPAYANPEIGQWTFNAMWGSKEFGLDTAARLMARTMLSGVIRNMVDTIQHGSRNRQGPSFIRNWRNLMTGGQYRGEDIFRSILNNTALCPGVNDSIKVAFRADRAVPLSQQVMQQGLRVDNFNTFQERARCSMPIGWSIDAFQRDFAGNGSWDALVRLSQPQNNFYGSFLMALGEANAQRALEAAGDVHEAVAGQGNTGIRGNSIIGPERGGICDDPPLSAGRCTRDITMTCRNDIECTRTPVCDAGLCTNDPNRTCTIDSECGLPFDRGPCDLSQRTAVPSQARCTFLGNVFTPGGLLGQATSKTIDQKIGWLITSDEISEVLVAIIDAIRRRLQNYMLRPDDPRTADEPARQTASRLPPGTFDDQYTQCVQSCSSSSRDDFGQCIIDCSNFAGLPEPGTDTQPPPPPQPPPAGTNFTITLQAANVDYVVAINGGGGAVNANASAGTTGTTFTLIDLNGDSLTSGDSVVIRTENSTNYLRAEGGGGSTLDATAVAAFAWETYTIIEVSGSGYIGDGDSVAFLADNSANYITAESGGGFGMDVGDSAISFRTTFTINGTGSGSGGGATCSSLGQSNNYETQVQTAMDNVVNNTTLDDGSRASSADMGAFLDAIVIELRNAGLRAGRVFNTTSGGLRNDTVIVGQSTDPDGTIYDLILSADSPGRIGDFLGLECRNHDSWSLLRDPVTGGSPPPPPTGNTYTITIQDSEGEFMAAEQGGNQAAGSTPPPVTSHRGGPAGAWETFTLYDLNGGTLENGNQIALRTSNNQTYFRVEGGGGTTLDTTATSVSDWETFTILKQNGTGTIVNGDLVAFQTWNNSNYLSDRQDPINNSDPVDASAGGIGSWETFTVNIP